ncbi:MAG: hypothetical protein WCC17_25830 [Candidatus Nitrosopolaris sp.]
MSWLRPFGLQFAIEGHKFLGLIDSGNVGRVKVMLNRQTAEMVGIQKFRKSKKTMHVNFNEGGVSDFPIYEDVPITIPGVSTVVVDAAVGRNNLVKIYSPKSINERTTPLHHDFMRDTIAVLSTAMVSFFLSSFSQR